MAQGHRTAGHSVLGFPTHNPTHRLTCLAGLPRTLAVPVVLQVVAPRMNDRQAAGAARVRVTRRAWRGADAGARGRDGSAGARPVGRNPLGVGGSRARFPSCSWRRCCSSWRARTSAGGARWPERREYRYRYSSDAGKFIAEIVVDEECLVLNYEGLWQREKDL